MTPTQLVEKMVNKNKSMMNDSKSYNIYDYSNEMLRIVLRAIEDVEIVKAKGKYDCGSWKSFVYLKPDFAEFMEEDRNG